mmetsp:Transcript_6855/g.7585  ORF Transcript_6855/g.7585 Transcript_6855/m.7585 type:complete len:128 (+) Transcript_6855:118-501(+)
MSEMGYRQENSRSRCTTSEDLLVESKQRMISHSNNCRIEYEEMARNVSNYEQILALSNELANILIIWSNFGTVLMLNDLLMLNHFAIPTLFNSRNKNIDSTCRFSNIDVISTRAQEDNFLNGNDSKG